MNGGKLNIGCGDHPLDGWVNTDVVQLPGLLRMDATRPFPFENEQFDYIFSEHMIEHVPYVGGVAMLKECYRVLKPGGRIRISTPTLDFLLEMYNGEYPEYLKWNCEVFTPYAPIDPAIAVNNFVRNWGHQFIWSRHLLRKTFREIGFNATGWYNVCQSDDPELRNLENVSREPPGFLQIETSTLEGEKPLHA